MTEQLCFDFGVIRKSVTSAHTWEILKLRRVAVLLFDNVSEVGGSHEAMLFTISFEAPEELSQAQHAFISEYCDD